MNDEHLERLLRDTIPPGPPAQLKARLLHKAGRKLAARRRAGIIRWAFAVAAGLLIAVNVAFTRVHEHRLEQITGRPAMMAPADEAAFAAMLSSRARELSAIMSDWGNS